MFGYIGLRLLRFGYIGSGFTMCDFIGIGISMFGNTVFELLRLGYICFGVWMFDVLGISTFGLGFLMLGYTGFELFIFGFFGFELLIFGFFGLRLLIFGYDGSPFRSFCRTLKSWPIFFQFRKTFFTELPIFNCCFVSTSHFVSEVSIMNYPGFIQNSLIKIINYYNFLLASELNE